MDFGMHFCFRMGAQTKKGKLEEMTIAIKWMMDTTMKGH